VNAPPETIVIAEPPEAEVDLSMLGRVTVRSGGRRAEREIEWRSRRPLATNYRAFTDAVLAVTVQMEVPTSVIGTLPERDRRKLMLAVVRLRGEESLWRGLYGSSLSFDERFFAVMLWSHDRLSERLAERLRTLAENRVSGFARAAVARPGIPRPLFGLDALKHMTIGFDAFRTYDKLLGPSRYERLFATSNALTGFGTAAKAAEGLATIKATDRAIARGFAASRPSVGLSRTVDLLGPFQAAASPALAERVAATSSLLRTASLFAGVRGQLAQFSGAGFPGYDFSRITRDVAGVMQRPYGLVRPHPLFAPGGFDALFPSLRTNWSAIAPVRDLLGPLREFQALGEFMRQWEADPLWFLFSAFGTRAARQLAGLTRDQVEQALLTALAEVVCDGEYVAALREVLRDAPHLNPMTREWLDHALELAAAGNWVKAVPPMLLGLEGALHRAAVEKALIIDRGGKFVPAEKVVKDMALDEDYTAFVIRRVFGGIGNAFRHGRADSGERDQVLFAIVALAGWVDRFLELNAMGVLASELSSRLDDAVAQVRQVPELPSGV
jgi:hypothetical protein